MTPFSSDALDDADDALNDADDAIEAELLADMAQKLGVLFARVSAQKPERGIQTLILRAKQLAAQEGCSLAEALEQTYQGALQRTEARLALTTQHCRLAAGSIEN